LSVSVPINGHFVLNRSQVRVHVAQAPFRQLLPPLKDGESHLALCLSPRVPINRHFDLNRSQVRVHVAQAASAPFKGGRESFSTLPESLSPYKWSFCFKYMTGKRAN